MNEINKRAIENAIESASGILLKKAKDISEDLCANRGIRLYVTIDVDVGEIPTMNIETSYTLL